MSNTRFLLTSFLVGIDANGLREIYYSAEVEAKT